MCARACVHVCVHTYVHVCVWQGCGGRGMRAAYEKRSGLWGRSGHCVCHRKSHCVTEYGSDARPRLLSEAGLADAGSQGGGAESGGGDAGLDP